MTEREITTPVDAFIKQIHRSPDRWEEERKIYKDQNGFLSAVTRFKRSAIKKQKEKEAARGEKP